MGATAYYIGEAVAALGASDQVWLNLWNPHASIALRVFLIVLVKRATGTGIYSAEIRRSTVRGTAGVTETPSAEHHVDRLVAPPSGAVVDAAVFTTPPTMSASVFVKWQASGRPGGGLIWHVPIDDENGIDLSQTIIVPGGTGLALAQVAAGATETMDFTLGWME